MRVDKISSNKINSKIIARVLLIFFVGIGCGQKDELPATKFIHKTDGRTLRASDANALPVDLNGDGINDYVFFLQLTANNDGDHLYAAINPLLFNEVISEPDNDAYFLNMGFAISHKQDDVIDGHLQESQVWTSNSSTLAIRHTRSDGSLWYEGQWQSGIPRVLAVRLVVGQSKHYGWMRVSFDPAKEVLKVIDYAFNQRAGEPLKASLSN